MKKLKQLALCAVLVTNSGWLLAEGVEVGGSSDYIGITQEKNYVHVIHEGRSVKVERAQDPNYQLRGYFAKTSRKCPPFCLHPLYVDPNVKTVGELEVVAFMENQLRDSTGIMIDARTPSWHKKGTIPGSINIPFTILSKEPSDNELKAKLRSFGARERENVSELDRKMEEWGITEAKYKTDEWDFTDAKDLLLWCNGPACGQSPRAIKGLLKAGYPADKIFYYRGGMQIWQLFGFSTALPKE